MEQFSNLFHPSRSVRLQGGAYIASLLNALKVPYLFTLPGSQDLPILDAIPQYAPGTQVVATRNERVSVHIAEGYGKAAHRLCVCLPTLGPGVANEPHGIYSAKRSASPLLALSPAQPPRKLLRGAEVFQGLDHIPFLEGISKKAFRCERSEELGPLLLKAAFTALEEPTGPVHLEISFPLLFAFHRYPLPDEEAITQALAPFYASESSPKGYLVIPEGWGENLRERFPRFSSLTLLRPGLPLATLPFALGVALAKRDLPVVALIPEELLLRSLDTLWLAHEQKVPFYVSSDPPEELPWLLRLLSFLPDCTGFPALPASPSLAPGLYLLLCPHGAQSP